MTNMAYMSVSAVPALQRAGHGRWLPQHHTAHRHGAGPPPQPRGGTPERGLRQVGVMSCHVMSYVSCYFFCVMLSVSCHFLCVMLTASRHVLCVMLSVSCNLCVMLSHILCVMLSNILCVMCHVIYLCPVMLPVSSECGLFVRLDPGLRGGSAQASRGEYSYKFASKRG